MKRIKKILKIEDRSDCETCTARNDSDLKFLTQVKATKLGKVPCPECGRPYTVWAAEADVSDS